MIPRPRTWRVAIDLDGVLAEHVRPFDPSVIGPPIPGAVELLEELVDLGVLLIVHTCRPAELARAWLEEQGLAYLDVWRGQGKPFADAYLDDRAVACRPLEDAEAFTRARHELELLLRAAPRQS